LAVFQDLPFNKGGFPMNLRIGVPLLFVIVAAAAFTQAGQEDAIRGVIADYDVALKAGDADAVMAAYTEDAVLMPSDSPALTGQEAVRAWYVALFETAAVDLDFSTDEVIVFGDWAFARVSYSGSSTPIEGASVELVGKAIFILQRDEGGSWKIARYLFNMDAPPSEQ
jgi:uncharacterized protein (TIGR02246 family)